MEFTILDNNTIYFNDRTEEKEKTKLYLEKNKDSLEVTTKRNIIGSFTVTLFMLFVFEFVIVGVMFGLLIVLNIGLYIHSCKKTVLDMTYSKDESRLDIVTTRGKETLYFIKELPKIKFTENKIVFMNKGISYSLEIRHEVRLFFEEIGKEFDSSIFH